MRKFLLVATRLIEPEGAHEHTHTRSFHALSTLFALPLLIFLIFLIFLLAVVLFGEFFNHAQEDPPDPLAGVPEQPDVENDVGFHREHDRDFERNWHVVALQRDETQEAADEIIRLREEVSFCGCLH